MAKTSGEIEKEFIEGLKASTGKDLKTWLADVKKSGIEKRNDIVKWLKEKEGFGHMNANLLTGIYLNNGQPVYGSEDNLLENQFVKCETMKPLFEELKKAILEWDSEVQFLPKKTYVSILKKREFAAINIKPKELRFGLDLGDMPFTETVQKSKLTGPMPRISHMLVLTDASQLTKEFYSLLKTSHDRTNS